LTKGHSISARQESALWSDGADNPVTTLGETLRHAIHLRVPLLLAMAARIRMSEADAGQLQDECTGIQFRLVPIGRRTPVSARKRSTGVGRDGFPSEEHQ
jgi:hypothetical protein